MYDSVLGQGVSGVTLVCGPPRVSGPVVNPILMFPVTEGMSEEVEVGTKVMPLLFCEGRKPRVSSVGRNISSTTVWDLSLVVQKYRSN